MIVGLFALCGWGIGGRLETSVGLATVGVGVATYIVVGLNLINSVRRGSMRARAAGGLLLAAAVAAVFLPGVVVYIIMGIRLFDGERGMWLFVAPFYTFPIVFCAFLAFLVCVYKVKMINTALEPAAGFHFSFRQAMKFDSRSCISGSSSSGDGFLDS